MKHFVYKRLIDGDVQRIVVGTRGDVHPITLYLQYRKHGAYQIRPILRDVYIAVLRKREADHGVFQFGKVSAARYHTMVGAEEAVYRRYRRFLDCSYERRQIKRYSKALALPYLGAAGKAVHYLTYVHIDIAVSIIYARDYIIIVLNIFDLYRNYAFVLYIFRALFV